MPLIKKTIVLSKEIAKGFVTIIKVGSSAGIKVVFNVPIGEKLLLGIKIDDMEQCNLIVDKEKSEYEISPNFFKADIVGVIVTDTVGNIFAEGGRKSLVDISAILKVGAARIAEPTTFKNINEQTTSQKAANSIPTYNVKEPKSGSSVLKEKIRAASNLNSGAENNDTPIIEVVPSENFFQSIRSRLEDIFTINPRENNLEKIIPDSRWVKIYYDGDDYYVVGMLAENDAVTHIAYGVPGLKTVKPPKEAMELCDYLPITESSGYWLMFQNSEDGKIVKI